MIQVKQMQDTHTMIVISATETCAFPSSCGRESIQKLQPDSPFDPRLIDTIVSLFDCAAGQVYLGTDIYTEIKKPGFGVSKDMVRNCP